MAAVRLSQRSMKIDLPQGSSLTPELPPISALFLIYFDVKAGYTICWKRSLPGIELEGAVEYKSLPSGLHMVKDDLVYFVHESYAGLSAFANTPASEESRNARMIAVGILVPLSYGRLGRSWKHTEMLIKLAQKLVVAPNETKVLEAFWEAHKADEDKKPDYTETAVESPSSTRFQPIMLQPTLTKGHGRTRSASDGTVLIESAYNVSPYHPVWSLSRLLDLCGPLIFPIYRAALLRRRILICGHPPVREICGFVYDVSVLSNIPFAVNDILAPSAPPQRLRPLFSVGVHDIPFLEDDSKASSASHDPYVTKDVDPCGLEVGHGWIACTTDDILAMKDKLYDFLITIPPSYSAEAKNKVWPKVESPRGTQIKATQRDLRRYRALKWGLSRTASEPLRKTSSTVNITEDDDCASSTSNSHKSTLLDTTDTDSIVEPLSWTALAYGGFIWWASAGEQSRLGTSMDDSENESILLDGFSLANPTMQTIQPTRPPAQSSPSEVQPTPAADTETNTDSTRAPAPSQDQSAKREMAIIAYFHRLTTLILTVISDIIDATSSSDDDDDDDAVDTSSQDGTDTDANAGIDADADTTIESIIYITKSDVAKMGLDEWSASDAAFVVEVCQVYFGRKAEVEGMNVDICGVRIC